MNRYSARDAVLSAFDSLEERTARVNFTTQEIVDEVMRHTDAFQESTIRTQITSRLCREAPKNHRITYDDLTRVSPGVYRRIN